MTKVAKIVCDYTNEDRIDKYVKIKRKTLKTRYDKDVTTRGKQSYHVKEEVIENIFGYIPPQMEFFTIDKEPVFYREMDMGSSSIYPCDKNAKTFFEEVMK